MSPTSRALDRFRAVYGEEAADEVAAHLTATVGA